jgi:phthiocerol/phenolphthiocerol synthesis type-I polyketide synthase E
MEATAAAAERHVAIIGMACRLPGAATVQEFWRGLIDGIESISTFTDEELLESGVEPRLVASPDYVRSRGVIGGADRFDAAFFGFTPREAELLDPQHRVFLECAWHALEDGGYVPGDAAGRIGVFGGVGTNWHLGAAHGHPDVRKVSSSASVVIANDKDYVTTRVSYKLGLTGPSVNVQSACSTALVATILGMNCLLSHQCDLVLAGGATIEVPEKQGYLFQDGGMESPDGHCRPFDAGANGTVFSRGGGVVLLKRLTDAIEDGDHIYAVILDGAINNDGALKMGFTAPSVNGQVEVAIEALERAGVTPDVLSFVEAHGTATALGDPIEVESLTQAFRAYTDAERYCALGSVKGNIGHTDVASGAAGLIKTALALEQGKLPPSLNFTAPNPKINFDRSPFFVNTELRDLPSGDRPRRALVNCFGVGGTNACAVLQEPPARTPSAPCRPEKLLLMSARTRAALDALTDSVRAHVQERPGIDLDALAYTYQVGRRAFACRRALVFSDRDDLLGQLDRSGGGPSTMVDADGALRVTFAFPGQGNQYAGMGRGLYLTEPVYRDVVDRASEVLKPILDADLRAILYGEDPVAASMLGQTRVTQPALFVTSYAVARLWMSWGLEPDAMIGHSVGEYVAGCLGGVFSFEDALVAVAHRGRLVQQLPGGSMLAVLLPEQEASARLTAGLSVAAINAPNLTVVSGPTDEVVSLEGQLRRDKVFSMRLETSHAFHSSMMDPALPEFERVLADVRLAAPLRPISSTLTGRWLTPAEATDPDYWTRHMREPVRFMDGLRTLLESDGRTMVLECGPGRSLSSAARHQIDRSSPHAVLASMRAEGDSESDANMMVKAAGELWKAGRAIDWTAFHGGRPPGRVSAPGYPFERQRYALTPVSAAPPPHTTPNGLELERWFYVPGWRRAPSPELVGARVDPAEQTWLVFEDELGIAVELYAILQRVGADVVSVRAGHEYRQLDDHTFSVGPGVRGDYDELAAALKRAGRAPVRIVHLWNVDGDTRAASLDCVESAEKRAFYSPLFLAQALSGHSMTRDVRLLVAADGVCDVTGEDVCCPLKALAVGPCRVIAKEIPEFRARFAAVAAPSAGGAARLLAEQVARELELDTAEAVVAFRGRHRWVECFENVRLAPGEDLAARLHAGGTYLITGGLGGLGLFLARQIADRVPAHLVLTHRTPLPPREHWPTWLSEHSAQDDTSQRIQGILELERAGATVTLAQADCADVAVMRSVVQEAEAGLGPIRGVIHAAGVAGGGIATLKTEEMAAEVLAPKIRGALVLHEVLAGAPLDFMLMFSSITSVLGEAGRVDYCAANNVMDALAHYWHQRERSSPVTSIGWDSWAEFGMAARWEASKDRSTPARASPLRDGGTDWLRSPAENGASECYDVLLDPEGDFVVSEHSLAGVPTLVGTAYLEFLDELRRLKRPECPTVVERLWFKSPLMLRSGAPRRLRLFIDPDGDRLPFSFKSQALDRDQTGPWLEHCAGELNLSAAAAPGKWDLAALRARCGGVDTRGFWSLRSSGDDTGPFSLGERWNCLTRVHVGDGEWLARLELPARFARDLDRHPFHPALVDVALAAAIRLTGAGWCLPLGYEGITLKRRCPAALWSHVRLLPTASDPDLLSLAITLLDDDGTELAAIDRYTLKRVNADSGPGTAAGRPATAGTAARSPAASTPPEGESSEEITPSEGVDALARILALAPQPQIVVSTRDLQTRIAQAAPGPDGGAGKDTGSSDGVLTAYARPELSTPYEEPANDIERAISEIWQAILGIAPIGANDHFIELGGNSLLAVQAAANTSDTYQLELTTEAFLRNPTVRGVAETVVSLLISLAGEETLEGLLAELES